MAYDVTFHPDFARHGAAYDRATLALLLEALVCANVEYLKAYPDHRYPIPRSASLPPQPGVWQTVAQIKKSGESDPKDLAAWREAISRLEGNAPRAVPVELVGGALSTGQAFRFKTGLFRGEFERALSNRVLQILLDTLTSMSEAYLRLVPAAKNQPDLYQAGIFYQREPLGEENWLAMPALYRQGFGDCEDLATTRAAQKRVREGINVRPFFSWRKLLGGGTLYHIKDRYPDGSEEDPSAKLGMLDKDGA